MLLLRLAFELYRFTYGFVILLWAYGFWFDARVGMVCFFFDDVAVNFVNLF